MQEDLEQLRSDSLTLCARLLASLEENKEDSHLFFSSEIFQAYDAATDKAKNKVLEIRNSLRTL